MGHLPMLPYQIFSTKWWITVDDEKNEIQQHQELKLTRRIDSKRILNFGNWRTVLVQQADQKNEKQQNWAFISVRESS